MIKRIFGSTRNFLLVLLLPLIIMAFPAILAAQDNTTSDTEEQRSRLEEIGEEKAKLERDLGEIKQAENLVNDDLEAIDTELTWLTRRIDRTTSNYETKKQQVDFFNESNAQAIEDLNKAQESFKIRLVEWYKAGTGSVLESILSAGDLSDFLLVMAYMEALMESDQTNIDFIREQQGRIVEQTEQLQVDIAECERLLSEMNVDLARFQELKDAHASRLTGIKDDRVAMEAAIRELDASSYEIAMLLQASQYTERFGTQGMIWPVDAPITSGYGVRNHPIFGGRRMHTGVDMPVPYGTLVHAAQDGIVVYASWKNGYGNTVIIDHGGNLATLYGHNSSVEVRVGEHVSRGQVIAKAGSTGYSTGPHVHFEVRVHGEPTDPLPYMPPK